MQNGKRNSRLILAGVLAAAVAASLTAVAFADPGHGHGQGNGKGREKVTLCHKGRVTITVTRPAVAAHLRHGDTQGPCTGTPSAAPAPGTATITVIKHVVNNNGGTKKAGDFTITINSVSVSGGNSFAGSESGVTRIVTTFGSYTVTEGSVDGYDQALSAGCSGTIVAGDQKTCTITNDDKPATITVIKHVSGGSLSAGNFTLAIAGVTAVGGNTFSGAESPGVTKTLTSVGTYSVTETAVTGYLQSTAGDCAGSIAVGQSKTCTITNTFVQQ